MVLEAILVHEPSLRVRAHSVLLQATVHLAHGVVGPIGALKKRLQGVVTVLLLVFDLVALDSDSHLFQFLHLQVVRDHLLPIRDVVRGPGEVLVSVHAVDSERVLSGVVHRLDPDGRCVRIGVGLLHGAEHLDVERAALRGHSHLFVLRFRPVVQGNVLSLIFGVDLDLVPGSGRFVDLHVVNVGRLKSVEGVRFPYGFEVLRVLLLQVVIF